MGYARAHMLLALSLALFNWMGPASAVESAAAPDSEAITASQLSREILLKSLRQTEKAYSFEYVVIYLPAGTIAGIDFPIPVTHIRYKNELFFGFNQSRLLPGSLKIIRDFADIVLQDSSLRSVLIVGHTDSIGSERYNHDLSIRRATTVFDELRRLGVPADILGVVPMGESQPIATNSTEEGRARNRRVEFFVSDIRDAAIRAIEQADFNPCFRNDHRRSVRAGDRPCEPPDKEIPVLLGADVDAGRTSLTIDLGHRSAIGDNASVPMRPPLPSQPRERRPLPVIRRLRRGRRPANRNRGRADAE